MAAIQFNFKSIVSQVKAELAHSRKKAVMLAAVLIVGACVFGRMLLNGSTPSSARAQIALAGGASDAGKASDESLCPAPGKSAKPQNKLINVESRRLDRDIFAPNADFFPPVESGGPVKVLADSELGEEELDERVQQQIIQAQAKSLLLQSTMVSDTPTALINGRVLRVGDWINGFAVTEVTPGTCTVQKGDVAIVLEMTKTQAE